MNTEARSRNWAFIVYPQDLNDGWKDRLSSSGLVGFISPLHDKDVYVSGDCKGQIKKAHYHVILTFGNARYYPSVLRLVQETIGKDKTNHDSVSKLEKIINLVASYEYLFHKNNPEKAQYSASDIVVLNGAAVPQGRDDKRKENFNMGCRVMKVATENGINNIGGLISWCFANQDVDLYCYIEGHAFFVRECLRNIVPYVEPVAVEPLPVQTEIAIQKTQMRDITCSDDTVPF